MTIMEILNHLDAVKPNGYSQDEKIKWLNQVEWTIKKEIVDTHEGADKIAFNGYNSTTSLAKKVIADAPYDKLYIHWLEAQIDYATGEYQKYQNSMTMFNEVYENYAKWYNREHMPVSHGGWKHW
jgi:hypothetical protein